MIHNEVLHDWSALYWKLLVQHSEMNKKKDIARLPPKFCGANAFLETVLTSADSAISQGLLVDCMRLDEHKCRVGLATSLPKVPICVNNFLPLKPVTSYAKTEKAEVERNDVKCWHGMLPITNSAL